MRFVALLLLILFVLPFFVPGLLLLMFLLFLFVLLLLPFMG